MSDGPVNRLVIGMAKGSGNARHTQDIDAPLPPQVGADSWQIDNRSGRCWLFGSRPKPDLYEHMAPDPALTVNMTTASCSFSVSRNGAGFHSRGDQGRFGRP